LDNHGRSYSVNTADIPTGRGDGVPASSLIDIQDKGQIVQALSGALDSRYLLSHTGAYGFVASVKDMLSRIKAGKAFMTVETGERLLTPQRLDEKMQAAQLVLLTNQQRLLVLPLLEVRQLSKGRGLMLLSLHAEEEVKELLIFEEKFILAGEGRAQKAQQSVLKAPDWQAYAGPRARRAKSIALTWKNYRLLPTTA
jgi:topoisomerase-4 subunit A